MYSWLSGIRCLPVQPCFGHVITRDDDVNALLMHDAPFTFG